jgi:putative nucleotidyltransferase with HDIG domain
MEFGDTVQYQALYTLYSGQYIYPVRRTLVLIISVVFMLLLVSTFSFSVKLASWTFTTLFTGIIAGSFILFSRTGIFIDPVLPALSGFLAFGSFLVVTLNEARSELSRGHELLSVLEGTQREITRVLRAQEIQGMKRRTYMPAFHEPFFERTPEITLQTITSILGIEYGVLFGVEKPTGDVRIFARTKGQMPREMLANLALLLGDRENLVVNRNVPESLRAHGVENMLLLAVLREPMITLYSFFVNKKPTVLSSTRGFSDSDYQWLVSFSLQTVVALLNTQLNIALRKSQMETIFRLASSIEYRDRETGQHITRVSEYAGEIAANIGLPNFEVELIKSAMPLHDLGKIAIPDSILLKPEALASQEKEVIKQHTIIGAKMLENSDSFILQAAYLIAISHHEKYDGSGYPYGLKGNAIPLYGRIAAIADVFDAFCSKRVYKSARSFNEALEYVSAMSGKDFDPQMVEAFLRDREKIFAIYSEYQEKG